MPGVLPQSLFGLITHRHPQGRVAPGGEAGHVFFPVGVRGEIAAAIPARAEIIGIGFAHLGLGDGQEVANGGRALVRGLRNHGVKDIYISATHAVFARPAMERLADCEFTKLAVTDTIPIGTRADAVKDRLVVLSVADLIGEAIHRIHHKESVSALFAKSKPKD